MSVTYPFISRLHSAHVHVALIVKPQKLMKALVANLTENLFRSYIYIYCTMLYVVLNNINFIC